MSPEELANLFNEASDTTVVSTVAALSAAEILAMLRTQPDVELFVARVILAMAKRIEALEP